MTLPFITLHASMLLSSLCLLPPALLHFVAPTCHSFSQWLLPPNALSYLNIFYQFERILAALILPTLGHCFTMVNAGTTNHMFSDKSAFISYKLVTNLQVRMGNNSFPSSSWSWFGGCLLKRSAYPCQECSLRAWSHCPPLQPPCPLCATQLWFYWSVRC
jgi:hypothetical protein